MALFCKIAGQSIADRRIHRGNGAPPPRESAPFIAVEPLEARQQCVIDELISLARGRAHGCGSSAASRRLKSTPRSTHQDKIVLRGGDREGARKVRVARVVAGDRAC